MSWSPQQERRNNEAIMAGNIDRDRVGQTLNAAERERAIQFAADVWKGQMGNGTAAKLGVKHVVDGRQ